MPGCSDRCGGQRRESSKRVLVDASSRERNFVKSRESSQGIVYSTEHGRMCPLCGKPEMLCECGRKKEIPLPGSVVAISRETKGRRGKGVTLISGIPLEEKELKELARYLKTKCGAGGTVKKGVVEIQGDHLEVLVKELTGMGWKVRRTGA